PLTPIFPGGVPARTSFHSCWTRWLEGLPRAVWHDRGALTRAAEKTMAGLNSLMIFARVVEARSFSEAGRRLKMPTSAVSRRVADLEAQLRIRLIERSTRSLRLTAWARSVRAHPAELRDQRGGPQHRLESWFDRVGGAAAFGTAEYLPHAARAPGRRVPDRLSKARIQVFNT